MNLYKRGRVWWLKYRTPDMSRPDRVSLRTRDHRTAQLRAAEIVRKAELRASGIVDPFDDHRHRALAAHVDDFLSTLRGVRKYLQERRRFLTDYVTATGAKRLSDLDCVPAERWLTVLERSNLSARSVNGRCKALRQFGRWLHENRRWPYNPFVGLSLRSERADRRHVRRALTPGEVGRLLAAARSRPFVSGRGVHAGAPLTPATIARLTKIGTARSIVYLLAVGTGLRRRELSMLRWCDIDFERRQLTVTVNSSKSRKRQMIDLHPNIVHALKSCRSENTGSTDTVILKGTFPTIRTFWKDLEAAGISRRDGQDRVVDLHALRTTYITWFTVNQEHPALAQAGARHGSITTTMEYYTDTRLLDTKGAVDRLPIPELDLSEDAS